VAVTTGAMADVTIAGRFDFGQKSVKSTAATGVVTKTSSLGGASSGATSDRLTFKGTEDLGGGMTAGFEYTMNLVPDAVNSAIGTAREAFITVGSDIGTLKVGTFTNVFDGMINNGWHNTVGTSLNLFPARTNSAIGYTSPKIGGMSFGIITMNDKTSVAGVTTQSSKVSGSILSAAYAAGPLSVNVGYGDASATTAEVLAMTAITPSSTVALDLTQLSMKASYDLGFANVAYMHVDAEASLGAVSSGFKANEVSAKFPMGSFTPFVSYNKADGNGSADTVAYKGTSVGVDYALSKRTYVYATTGSKKYSTAGVQTTKTSATAMGLVHSF
jgi:predicted porin